MAQRRAICTQWVQPILGDTMKVGDLVRLKDDNTGRWGIGILIEDMDQFQGWVVQWPRVGHAGRSFHSSRHLEVINEGR